MTVLAPATVGWCPGVLRPMQTGDGFVVRVKPRGGVLSLDQAEAIGELALRFGNGHLDLTGRANIQIRGVEAADHAKLVRELGTSGLLDRSSAAEAVRNVVASPLAGLDPQRPDIRPFTTALEQVLVREPALWALPAKWSFVIDDGGTWSLSSIPADVRFEAASDGSMVVGLAGSDLRAPCLPTEIAAVASALCRFAIGQREPRRMKALAERHGAKQILAAANLAGAPRVHDAEPTLPQDVVGPYRLGTAVHFGVAVPFGHLDARDLLRLIDAARDAHAIDFRLTPWRGLVVTGLAEVAAARFEAAVRRTALITEATDPRLAVAACSGAPACQRGTTPVRAEAATLARTSRIGATRGVAIHVSGCSKGCAHSGTAPWTLVGRDGHYDLVRNGRAADTPIVSGLTFQEASTWLSREAHEGRS